MSDIEYYTKEYNFRTRLVLDTILSTSYYGCMVHKYHWSHDTVQLKCSFCGKCGNYLENRTSIVPIKILCYCENPLA